jgi:hypothetical protein
MLVKLSGHKELKRPYSKLVLTIVCSDLVRTFDAIYPAAYQQPKYQSADHGCGVQAQLQARIAYGIVWPGSGFKSARKTGFTIAIT